MPVAPQLQELIDRWEDFQEQGVEVSAEELCKDYPELREELQRHIKALKAMAWLSDNDPGTGHGGDEVADHELDRLPHTLGRYRLDELVGMGGFGQVWKGYDPELQRVVAIKVPRPEHLSPQQTEAFLQEARKVAQLKHPGIVPVHDVGRDGEYCFIVSDFVEGGNLAERLRKGRFNWQESARLIADVAETLDHAHRQGFIHRDIKPANILLDKTGTPYLTDFGIAVDRTDFVGVGPSIGTLAYMSPEQITQNQVDVRTDIYSLGVVLYELLTGQRPFAEKTAGGLRERILSSTPSAIESRDIPVVLRRTCLRCLARDSAKRYAAASDLAAALRESLSRNPHRPRRASFLGALLILLLSAAIIGYWSWCRNSGSTQSSPEPMSQTSGAKDLLKSGIALFERQEFRAATVELTKAIQHDPQLAEAYHRRGACYFNLGETEKALSDLNRALELDPKNAEAYKHRALTNIHLRLFDKALSDAGEALRLDPANAEACKRLLVLAHHVRATDHNNHLRWSDALTDANEMIRLQPSNAEAYAVRGTIYYNLRNFDRAVADFNKTIELEPNNPKRYKQRSDSLRGAGRSDEANADREKARTLEEKP